MPVKDFRLVATLPTDLPCSELVTIDEITDYVVVIRVIFPVSTIHVIPLSIFPCDELPGAATFTLQDAPHFLFFLNDLTLCFIGHYYEVEGVNYRIKLTRITASDREFTNTTTTEQEIHALQDCSILDFKAMRFCNDSTRKIVLWLQTDKRERYQREMYSVEYDDKPNAKTTLTVSLASAVCGELVPISDCGYGRTRGPEREAGDFVVRDRIIFIDTGHSLMNWMEADLVDKIVWKRWLSRRSADKKLLLSDALEISGVPFAELETTPHYNEIDVTLKVSQSGIGMVAYDGKIHKFHVTAYCQPLELLAAMVTFDQLSEEMRDDINAAGPYDFNTLIHICSADFDIN